MKKFKNILLCLLLLVLCSCEYKLPIPFVGYYRVSELKESTDAYYYLAFREDNTFAIYQAGGAASSKPFIFEGKWRAELQAFDFVKGEGILTLYDIKGPSDIIGLVLKVGKECNYRFYWTHDRNTADATLSLESLNKYYCKDIDKGFNITKEEFERITGIKEATV